MVVVIVVGVVLAVLWLWESVEGGGGGGCGGLWCEIAGGGVASKWFASSGSRFG